MSKVTTHFILNREMPTKTDNQSFRVLKLSFFDILLIVIGGVYLTIVRHYDSFIVNNQTGYFLYGLRLYDPTFIPQDWFTWEVFHHHFAFGYLLYFLQIIGPLKITTEIAQLVMMTALSLGLLILSKRFCCYPRHVYFALLTWMGFHTLFEIGLGGMHLIMGYFQPSEIAGPLMILGFSLLFAHRYLVSGVVLGFAGLFHGAIFFSYAPIILVTAFFIGIWRNWTSLLSFGIPLGILWGIFILVVGNAILQFSPPTGDVMSILTEFRAFGDWHISNWPKAGAMKWIMWTGIGSIALFISREDNKFRELRISFISIIFLSIIGIIFLETFRHSPISEAHLWRSSPLALLLGLLIALDRCLHILVKNNKLEQGDYLFVASLIFGCIWLAANGWGSGKRILWLMSFPLSIGAGWIVSELRNIVKNRFLMYAITSIMLIGLPVLICHQSVVPVLFGRYSILQFCCIIIYVLSLFVILFITIYPDATVSKLEKYNISRAKAVLTSFFIMMVFVMCLSLSYGQLNRIYRFYNPISSTETVMEEWVHENTPEDSIFIIHPNMSHMRIGSRRAVVVDEKSVATMSSHLQEWYRRICDVCGYPATLPAVIPEHIVIEGYRNLDTERARFLQKRYGANYVVVLAKEHIGDLSGLKERFQNDDYLVLEIPFTEN